MVTDFLLKNYIRYFYIPKVFRYYPGFIVVSFDYKRTGVMERDVILPEDFVANVERRVVQKSGEAGQKLLYLVGKTFTWNYWKMLKVEPVKNLKEAEKYLKTFLYFVTITYSSDVIKYKSENENLVRFYLKDWIICGKNGLGYISSGLWAGTAAASIGQRKVEAIHPKCQGRGDEAEEALVGFPEELEKIYPHVKVTRCEEFPNYRIEDIKYRLLNKPQPVPNKSSLEDFIKERFLSLKGGILSLPKMRFFWIEITFLHLLESMISSDLIFEEARVSGIRLFDALGTEDPSVLCEFLAAIGFGGLTYHKLGEEEIIKVYYYPYSCCLKNLEFPFLCGLLSGWFTALREKNVEFKVTKYEEKDSNILIKASKQ